MKGVPISEEMFFDECHKYLADESIDLIRKAFDYAKEKHEGQFRKSGDPYFVHVIAVGYILASIQGGPRTIMAGLLHDVMEDCGVTRQEMIERFGEEVTTIVESVTKVGKIEFKDEKEYQAANHRKIFIAMAKDVRVILVKLADRLHNMRTLEFMPKEKQGRIASETLEVYAPIAHRLGLSTIKNELEDLSFFYLNPEKYHEIANLVETKKEERNQMIQQMIAEMTDLLNEHNFQFRIFGRPKHLYSIYNKMETKHKRFEEILDLYAIRIVTQSELNCYEILGYIHAKYTPIPGRLKDYIAMPKANMYQSLHTTIVAEGNIFEVQIRTEQMDQVAELGVAAHWRYKEGSKYSPEKEQKEIEEKLAWFRDLAILTDEEASGSAESYMDALQKDLFEANVYVMSPKGRVVDLPNGSTPLDFAYRIHTEIGNSTIGALVNGYLVPLNTKLKTGDVVTIKTSKQSAGPSEDWLNIVHTAHARNKIRQVLQKREEAERAEYIEKGQQIIKDEMKKRGLDENEYLDKTHLDAVYSSLQVKDFDVLCYGLAAKSISLMQVMEKLTKAKSNSPTDLTIGSFLKKKENKKLYSNIGVSVEGIDSMMISFAGCCSPIYGDEIVGYISKGQGVKVHRKECGYVKDNPRLIDVQWDDTAESKTYETELNVYCTDRNFLVSDVVTTISQCKVSLQGINSQMLSDKISVFIKLKVQVKSLEHLEILIANLRKVNSVTTVERTIQ